MLYNIWLMRLVFTLVVLVCSVKPIDRGKSVHYNYFSCEKFCRSPQQHG